MVLLQVAHVVAEAAEGQVALHAREVRLLKHEVLVAGVGSGVRVGRVVQVQRVGLWVRSWRRVVRLREEVRNIVDFNLRFEGGPNA